MEASGVRSGQERAGPRGGVHGARRVLPCGAQERGCSRTQEWLEWTPSPSSCLRNGEGDGVASSTDGDVCMKAQRGASTSQVPTQRSPSLPRTLVSLGLPHPVRPRAGPPHPPLPPPHTLAQYAPGPHAATSLTSSPGLGWAGARVGWTDPLFSCCSVCGKKNCFLQNCSHIAPLH